MKRAVSINAHSEETNAEIERLEKLGYDRRDISVLPDGSVTIVHHNEFQSSHDTIAKATARDRLEKMYARKQELDYMATATAVAGMTLDPDVEVEYRKLLDEIEATQKLID